jgi:hypothetical protein
MTPVAILETIRAVAEAVAEYFRWLQTEQGKRFSDQVMSDRVAWDKFWIDAGIGLKRLFSGELLK